MSALRPFRATDLFRFNNLNLDVLTETYSISFYLSYLAKWPDLCSVQVSPNGRLMGYIIGKAEGVNQEWHGHITALSVAPEYRRLGLARKLVAYLDFVSDAVYRGFFVDLYVRCNNAVAIAMYEQLGYSIYRRVRQYYVALGASGDHDNEDAFDMRKPLSRDVNRGSVRPNGRNYVVPASQVS